MCIYSKEDFICFWESEIDSYKKEEVFNITYPFNSKESQDEINNKLSEFQDDNMTEDELYANLYHKQVEVQKENENVRDFYTRVTKDKIFEVPPKYLVKINKNEGTDQYSYENGYFLAFKILVSFAVSPSIIYDESELYLPIFFLARHYIELSLKDAIFNLSIVTGKPLKIGESPKHNLCQLSEDFETLLTEYKFYSEKSENSRNLILNKTFFNIPKAISKLSQKSDEFRYPVNSQGEISISRNKPTLFNLLGLTKDMNYFFACMDSLSLVVNSSFQDTVYEDDTIIGVLNKLWLQKKKILVDTDKPCHLRQDYQNTILKLFKKAYLNNNDEKPDEVCRTIKETVSFEQSDTETKVFWYNDFVFSICSCPNENNFYIKTDKLIK